MFSYWLGWFLVVSGFGLTLVNFVRLMRLNADFQRYLRRTHSDYWADADENLVRMFPLGSNSIVTLIFSKENLGDPLLERKKCALKQQLLFTCLYLLGTGLMFIFVYHFFWTT